MGRAEVPFLQLKQTYDELKEELDLAYRRVMDSGWFVLGQEVEAFEAEFASYCGAASCVGVGSGLDSLRLALSAAGIGADHEVIVPANTFIATWLAVSAAGASSVPVDAREADFNMDLAAVEAAITSRTRAIIPVHMYGLPAPMVELRALADRHSLLLVDDAAQAHGALLGGAAPGAHAHASCFSFYPAKNLGAFGDGGAMVTSDEALEATARVVANYGSAEKYVHDRDGINSRLDELQAAFLRVKLQRLDSWNRRRRDLADIYLGELEGLDVELPPVAADATPAWHLFVVRVDDRDGLQRYLLERGVQTQIHYPVAPHLSGCYASMGHGPGDFPVTERLCQRVLSRPLGPHLAREQVIRVCAEVKGFFS